MSFDFFFGIIMYLLFCMAEERRVARDKCLALSGRTVTARQTPWRPFDLTALARLKLKSNKRWETDIGMGVCLRVPRSECLPRLCVELMTGM